VISAVIQTDDTFEMADYLPGTIDFLSIDREIWAIQQML